MSFRAVRWLHTGNLLLTLGLFGAALGWTACSWWLGCAGVGALWLGLVVEARAMGRLLADHEGPLPPAARSMWLSRGLAWVLSLLALFAFVARLGAR